jgi:TetR/AcrR family transcriptional regulator, transcriptional repressor for nem operon
VPRVSDAKEKLMEAALDLIWERSYGATSVDDICSKAGVKKGSFYYFFKSKSDLEIAALEANWAVSRRRLNEIFSPTVPPLERFEQLFDYVACKQASLQEECGCVLGCPLFTIGSEVSTREAGIREKVHAILNSYAQFFESAIRDAHSQGLIVAPDAKLKSKVLFAYFQGTLTHARIENNIELLRGLKEGAFALLGVKRDEPTSA